MGKFKEVLSKVNFFWKYLLRGTKYMIFVTVGSQKFQFDRLFSIIDGLIDNNIINGDKVFGQLGNSTYTPKKFDSKRFLSESEISCYYENADIIITHAGTGTIINGLKKKKKVIVFPRDRKYGEHVDNHQYQISESFSSLGYCAQACDYESLKNIILEIDNFAFKVFESNTKLFSHKLLNSLEELIESEN